jgi:hypothetical protein
MNKMAEELTNFPAFCQAVLQDMVKFPPERSGSCDMLRSAISRARENQLMCPAEALAKRGL